MKALIDADLVLYSACHAVQQRMYIGYNEEGEAYTCSPRKKDLIDGYTAFEYKTMVSPDSFSEGCVIIDEKIANILIETGVDDHVLYLTGGGNFRKEIYPEYKANRIDKPLMYNVLKDYMVQELNAVVVEGQEADDAMGIAQGSDTIICSYDKDMLMIPGLHYKFNKKEFISVTEEEGLRTFYLQLLTGDRVDNIPGLRGVGPKTAEKILSECTTAKEMYEAVIEAYESCCETVLRNARLIYIRQNEDELWEPPR